jgi:hypothetical protein
VDGQLSGASVSCGPPVAEGGAPNNEGGPRTGARGRGPIGGRQASAAKAEGKAARRVGGGGGR